MVAGLPECISGLAKTEWIVIGERHKADLTHESGERLGEVT